jgi:ribosome modulation factor
LKPQEKEIYIMTLTRLVVPALSLFLGATGLCMASAPGMSQAPGNPNYAQDHGGWDTPPQELQEIQRHGFHDGIEAARNDFGNHRHPDVNSRDEYRNPRIPREQRDAYRDGFRRGYQVGISHFMGGDQQPMGGPGERMGGQDHGGPDMGPGMGMDMGPGMGSDIQRRGFQDGMDGARKDLDSHRQPNVNNRDEYRHPHVPSGMRNDYREAYRRGYDRGISRQMDGQMGDHDHRN